MESSMHKEISTTGRARAQALVLVLCALGMVGILAFLTHGMVDNAIGPERVETVLRVEGVRNMQKGCPTIARRLDEYVMDGRVTDDEQAAIETIYANQRALPRGLATCR